MVMILILSFTTSPDASTLVQSDDQTVVASESDSDSITTHQTRVVVTSDILLIGVGSRCEPRHVHDSGATS